MMTKNKPGMMTVPLKSLFALIGTLQGFVLWWLWHADKFHQWPASEPMAFVALLYAVVAAPLAVYWMQGVEGLCGRRRGVAVAVYALGYAALGAYSAWAADPAPDDIGLHPPHVLAAIVLGFVSLSLLCGFDFPARRWRYTRLFQYTWRNGILSATAAAMTGAVWTVLYAGAALMGLIQVKWVLELIQEPVFGFPVTGLVVAGAFALGLARTAMTEAIRRFWLSMSSWLLLLILFFGVMWVLWVPFTGLEALFSTKHAAFMMLWFSALAVKFANCAYQDGEIVWPYPRWLSLATQAAWLSLLPVVAIAWWALDLRVAQYGWSEDRLWAALVATVALIYAVGYALSWLRSGRWMAAIASTNIVAALVLCGGCWPLSRRWPMSSGWPCLRTSAASPLRAVAWSRTGTICAGVQAALAGPPCGNWPQALAYPPGSNGPSSPPRRWLKPAVTPTRRKSTAPRRWSQNLPSIPLAKPCQPPLFRTRWVTRVIGN